MRSFLMLVVLLVPGVVCGATVESNTKVTFGPESDPYSLGNYSAKVDQDLFGDYTETWFEFKQVSATEYSVGVTNVNLDESADWYFVESGDLFSKESIAGGEFTPLFTAGHWSTTGLWLPAVTVGSDFYLGVNTGNYVDYFPGMSDYRDVFGWVHFQVLATPLPFPTFDDDFLIMVENVMSYGSPGIIVGTQMVVPEPSTIALTSIAFVTLVTLRRRS